MNEIYGQKNIIYNSDILTGEEKKEFIFTTAPLVYNDSLIVSGLDGCNPTTDLYLLYDGGIRDGLWRYKDENNVLHQMNQYNYCGHFDSPTPAPSFDLNFGDCKAYFYNNVYYTDNNLFNLYHYNTYKNISEGKMMTAYFWLNEDDIAGLKLSDKIVVDHITYIINSITDYNPFSNDSTKVELVLFDNIYTKAPSRKKPIRLSAHTINDIGFIQGNNSSNRQSNIATNVNILGLENRVSASDVIVLGNNNVIGYPNTTVIGNQWNTTGDTSNSVLIGEYKGQDVTPDSIILSAPNIILDGTIQLDGSLDHNTLTNLQGGTTNQYYHTTEPEYYRIQHPLWTSGSTGFYSIKTNNRSGNDATGNYAISEGYKTNAKGVMSHAEGNTTAATGAYSHSEGRNTQATNSQAHAEGYGTIAQGDSSHSEGKDTRATGAYSHSQNRDTRATGDYTYAGGYNSQATGSTSFVHSYNSVCGGARSAVIGGQNIYGYDDDTVYVPNLYVVNNTFINGEFSADTIYADTIYTHTISGMSPVNINNVIIDDIGVLTATDVYGKATFKSKTVTIAGGTNTVVTDGSGTLFDKTAANYVTWSGDTCILQYDGNYIIDFALYGSGGSNVDWQLQRATQRGGVTTYGDAVAYFTTNGAANYDGGTLTAFLIGGQVGDIVWLALSRIGGSGNFTARSGRFQIRRT